MLETRGQDVKLQEENTQQTLPESQGRDWALSVLARADEAAAEADSAVMVESMLDLMLEVSQAGAANFFQLDPGTDEFVITQMRGGAESQFMVGLRFNRQQVLPGISPFDAKVMVVGDLPSEPEWLRAVDPERTVRKTNIITIPISIKERTLGVIHIFNYQRAEIDLLMLVGHRLAIELDHRQEAGSIRQSYRRLLTLVDTLGEVAGTLDRNRLLHLVTEHASRLVGAERSSIFLVDPNTKEMLFQVAYQPPEEASLTPGGDKAAKPALLHRAQPTHWIETNRTSGFDNPQPDEFSYFNRAVITVPLQSGLPVEDSADDHRQAIGGMMVINRQSASFQKEDAQLMRILADQASTFLQVAEMYESAGELFLDVIKALVTTIDAKDPYTQGHSQRVSDLSVSIAQKLGLDETRVNDIRIGGLFHDIGKIGIPDVILTKNGKLNEQEIEVIKQHPRLGVNILSQVKLLEPLAPAILEHHERLDGSGYPARLAGKQISWMGRIVAVADVYDAMTSTRPYRQALCDWEALAYLKEKAGILFDAHCVQALENILALTGEG
jgi:putative nucleotidyltransferase with HDIG domain